MTTATKPQLRTNANGKRLPISVTVTRAEGRIPLPKPYKAKTFKDADDMLGLWALSAPQTGGYDKCDFVVNYGDGDVYSGRFDLTYDHRFRSDLLGKHMRGHLGLIAGTAKPGHMSDSDFDRLRSRLDEKQQKDAREFLDNYAIGREDEGT